MVYVVLEFAESLQHTSKSVQRYAFLVWILFKHCGLFYYLTSMRQISKRDSTPRSRV